MTRMVGALVPLAAGVVGAALLGLQPGYPNVQGNRAVSLSPFSYDPATRILALDTVPMAILFTQGGAPSAITASPSLTARTLVDNTGALIGGVAGDDLVLTGTISGSPYSGTLLTGEVTGFGHQDTGPGIDYFDLRFRVTGGTLAALFTGQDIGLRIIGEGSSFSGDFTQPFRTQGKFSLGPVPGACSVGDLVWNDANRNGIQDTGEPGIDGVRVSLLLNGQVTATTVSGVGPSDQHGYYRLAAACPATFRVEVDLATVPQGFVPTVNLAGGDAGLDSNGSPAPVTLASSSGTDQTIDFGFTPPCSASLGDRVWHDLNRNGIQDPAEPGLDNVTVRLMRAGLTVATTATSGGGIYGFSGLCPGYYSVEVDAGTLPPGLTPAETAAGADRAADSNGSPADANLPADDSTDTTIDFGYKAPCTGVIGDFIWHDQNQNGIQDSGEPGLDGVAIRLLDASGTTIATATSQTLGAVHGAYRFTGLCAGTYTVELDTPSIPDGFSATRTAAGPPADDSNASPSAVTLAADSGTDLTVDFGLKAPCAGRIGDRVWKDLDRDGVQDTGEWGIPGVRLNLRDASNTVLATVTSDSSGLYAFTGRCPGAYRVEAVTPSGLERTLLHVGDSATDSNAAETAAPVTLPVDDAADLTIDFGFTCKLNGSLGDRVWNDGDGDGAQEAGEEGLSGWTVTLKDDEGRTLKTATTSGDGIYSFTNLPAATYRVCVSPETGWSQTYDLDGLATANCAAASLAAGANRTDVDFGFSQQAAASDKLGDRVWVDADQDGRQDSSEPGIPGVTVRLYACGGSSVKAVATTAANGAYLFTGLAAGSYFVEFVKPANFAWTKPDRTDDALDSDANQASGRTGCVTVPNLTVDAGLVAAKPACPFTIGYWKNHEKSWRVSSMVLGDETYSKAELLAILNEESLGDASMILAKQLIAAKLNLYNGADSDPILTWVAQADALLAAYPGRLPYRVTMTDTIEMVKDKLDAYNNGMLTAPERG